MTFLQLSEWTQQDRSDYYPVLMQHHVLIIAEVGKTSKKTVSKALNINPSQFSGVFGCLVAHNAIMEANHAEAN